MARSFMARTWAGAGVASSGGYVLDYYRRHLQAKVRERLARKQPAEVAAGCFALRIRLGRPRVEAEIIPDAPPPIMATVAMPPIRLRLGPGKADVAAGWSFTAKCIDAPGLWTWAKRITAIRTLEDHLLTVGFDGDSLRLAKRLGIVDVYEAYLDTKEAFHAAPLHD